MSIDTLGLEWAQKFHELYERLAPEYGYETRTDTRQFESESKNGRLMVAVCGELMRQAEQLYTAAAIADAARACAVRAARHGDAAERLLPGTAAIEFMALRGESAACERAVRGLADASGAGDDGKIRKKVNK